MHASFSAVFRCFERIFYFHRSLEELCLDLDPNFDQSPDGSFKRMVSHFHERIKKGSESRIGHYFRLCLRTAAKIVCSFHPPIRTSPSAQIDNPNNLSTKKKQTNKQTNKQNNSNLQGFKKSKEPPINPEQFCDFLSISYGNSPYRLAPSSFARKQDCY